jgi:phosphohistidine swiveling domain-containing protein
MAASNPWAQRFGSPTAPGPGVWHRDREHGRVKHEKISEYMGSDEHRATHLVKERFGTGDTRGWGHWRPEGHKPWPKTMAAGGPGPGGAKRETVGEIRWAQGGFPAPPVRPPLNLSTATTVEELLPLLSAAAKGKSIFELKPWRGDLAEWEERQKPAAIKVHRALQAVNMGALSDAQLVSHVERCLANSQFAGGLHAHFGQAFGGPLNVFLAQAMSWIEEGNRAGAARVLVDCLAGSSLPTVIASNAESIDLLRADLLCQTAAPTDEQLQRLITEEPVAQAWFQHVCFRMIDGHTGYATPHVLQEVPEVMFGLLRHCIETVKARRLAGLADSGPYPVVAAVAEAAEATARGWIAVKHHAEFAHLLAEAKTTYKLRDERVNMADAMADGITRLAFLELGKRLEAAGCLPAGRATDVMEGHPPQLYACLLSPESVDVAALARELREASEARAASVHHTAPPTLEGAALPVPDKAADDPTAYEALLGSLSEEMATVLAATHRYNSVRGLLEAEILGPTAGDTGLPLLRGVGITGRIFEGPALVGVMGVDVHPSQLVDQKLVFVTAATSSPFNLVIPLLGALVCDGGSLLSHPAITAREHGTPCVVNVLGCCVLIKTGDIVRVDADSNTVQVIQRAG